MYILYVPRDLPLVQHLPTSCSQHGSQAVLFHIPATRYWLAQNLDRPDQVDALPTELCLLDYYSVTFLSCWVSNGTGWVCAILDFSCFVLGTDFIYLIQDCSWVRHRPSGGANMWFYLKNSKSAWNQENVGLGWGRPARGFLRFILSHPLSQPPHVVERKLLMPSRPPPSVKNIRQFWLHTINRLVLVSDPMYEFMTPIRTEKYFPPINIAPLKLQNFHQINIKANTQTSVHNGYRVKPIPRPQHFRVWWPIWVGQGFLKTTCLILIWFDFACFDRNFLSSFYLIW